METITVSSLEIGSRIKWDDTWEARDQHLAHMRCSLNANCCYYLSFGLNYVQNSHRKILRISNTDETHIFHFECLIQRTSFCESLSKHWASLSSTVGPQSRRFQCRRGHQNPIWGFLKKHKMPGDADLIDVWWVPGIRSLKKKFHKWLRFSG